MRRGAFIVIDGTDGSGKATQTKLLMAALKERNIPVQSLSFPRYGKKSAALVEEYLAGAFGSVQETRPYPCSIFYAVDRYAAQSEIRAWLATGTVVIADRYVSANMGHQGAKLTNPVERDHFFAWNEDLEYRLLGLERPDITIVLHVPAEVSYAMARDRYDAKGGVINDIHENNLEHLKQAEQTYLEIAHRFPGFIVIECVKAGVLLSPETIHERILTIVQTLLLSRF